MVDKQQRSGPAASAVTLRLLGVNYRTALDRATWCCQSAAMAKRPNEATYSLRIDRDLLARLREIAATEHRTVAEKFRVMVEREVAEHEEDR